MCVWSAWHLGEDLRVMALGKGSEGHGFKPHRSFQAIFQPRLPQKNPINIPRQTIKCSLND